jgi:hypothetical protein
MALAMPTTTAGGCLVTQETDQSGSGQDADHPEDGKQAPGIDYQKILDKGKAIFGSTAWLSSLALIIAAFSLTFLVYNDKICGIDNLGTNGISKIRFRAPDSKCDSDQVNPADTKTPDGNVANVAGIGGTAPSPVTALGLSKQLQQIVADVRDRNGLSKDALLSVTARAEIEDRISENDLLSDLRDKARKRAGLFANYGSTRKATVPSSPQPDGCQVYAKKKDAGKWLVLEGPNGKEIVRYANDSLPDEIGGRAVVTEIQLSGKDALWLNIDLSGNEDYYTAVYAREASEDERNRRQC